MTGANRGIGRSIALALAREGGKVTVVARDAVRLGDVVEELGGKDAGHFAIAVDLMESGAPLELAETLVSEGPIEIVVHNVGGTLGVRSALATVEDWNRVWMFNVGIAIAMNSVLVPPMQAQRWGRVVHVSSISAINLRGSPAYGSAKAGLNAYVKGLGRAVASDNVIASAILPGAVDAPGGHWEQVAKNNPEIIPDFLRHHQAIGRFGTPDEVAELALFMCSNQASFCAGALVEVDGGTM